MTNGLADGIVDTRLLDMADEYLQGQRRISLHASVTYIVSLSCNFDSLSIDCTNDSNADSRTWERMPRLGIRIWRWSSVIVLSNALEMKYI